VGNGTSGSNGTLQFNNVQANITGPRVITIAYINGDSTYRTASMSVNGATASTVNFPSTGSWTTVGTVKLVVNLNTGSNTIKFSNSSAWTPDFDKISVLAPQTPTATKYEAESSTNTLSGSAVAQTCSGCSGGKNVGYIGNGTSGSNGTLQFNNVSVSTAGSHQLVISYIDGDSSTYGIGTSRTASISVNGGTAFTVSFPATGDWSEVVTTTVAVNLNAGNNTIKFSNSSAWTPDIDKIDVA
jgi:alpha-galactosidase